MASPTVGSKAVGVSALSGGLAILVSFLAGVTFPTILPSSALPGISPSSTPILSSLATLLHLPLSSNGSLAGAPTHSTTTSSNDAALDPSSSSSSSAPLYDCDVSHTYRTTLISLDPLLIYLHAFAPPPDRRALIFAAEADGGFAASSVVKQGRATHTPDRTSQSAALPRSEPAVACVLDRAQQFMAPALFRQGRDDMGPPQLVRYDGAGTRFNLHRDWFDRPQPVKGEDWDEQTGRRRRRAWNRVASFFVFLEDECEGGETHFPYIEVGGLPVESRRALQGEEGSSGEKGGSTSNTAAEGQGSDSRPLWRAVPPSEGGGIAFRPVAGNALFWVNLFANGTGDMRVRHAGLPVLAGRKTAMNIWPRQFVGPDA